MSSSSDGSQLMLYNGIGIPNAVVELRGNTRVICWKAAATYYLGDCRVHRVLICRERARTPETLP